uniref:Putative LOV domain-containing protein n=1 Tax=Dunaliella tertiolecta TaxID=3047 RepID=A0A140F7H4_DUNTE|nr:putative LOV domain-containing protein [Dunaliella tertiolecta]
MRRAEQKAEREKEKEKELQKPLEKEDSACFLESKPWHNAAVHRPSCASPPQDNSFCMEDEPHAVLVENYFFSLSVSDPLEPGNPLVFVSPGFEQQSGYPSSEVLGNNCKILQGDETEAEKVAEIRAGMDTRRFTSVELTNYKQDGRPYTNLLSIAPVVDGYDNLVKFVGVQCDLNERKRWEQVDEVFVSRWQEQVRQCLDMFMILDSSALDSCSLASVSAVSAGFSAFTGYRQVDVLGSSCLCLAGPDSSPKALKKLVQAQSASKPSRRL